MKLAHIACAGILLLASGAAAQDGDKTIRKTTISLGTATPGGGTPGIQARASSRDQNSANGFDQNCIRTEQRKGYRPRHPAASREHRS